MRGPLKEQIQNAINRALHDSLGLNPGGDSQSAYVNVGGRRRNRKKKPKNKKSNGNKGSAWSTIHLHASEPPVRSRVDIPPKAKGASPQVTKAKKTCKEIKARLSPPRCRKAMEAASESRMMERSESFEVQGPNRVKRSRLRKSGGSMYEAFMSGFKTTFSVSDDEASADATPGSSEDSSVLISKGEERLQQAEGTAEVSRQNPFDTDSGSDNYACTVDSEETQLNGDDSRNSGLSSGGLESPSDDRKRELGGTQQKVDVVFKAGDGLAQDSVGVSVAYQQQGSFGEYSDFTTHTSHEYSDCVDLSSSTVTSTSSSYGGATTSEGGGSAVLEKKLSETWGSHERGEYSISSPSTTCTITSVLGNEQEIHDTVPSPPVSKRLSSFRSADRGESFEVETPKTLRRQGRHGFIMGAGGFQTSIHFSVSEDEELTREIHRGTNGTEFNDSRLPTTLQETDSMTATITHTSERTLESQRLGDTSDQREVDSNNQSEVECGQGDSNACVKSDSFEYVHSNVLSSESVMISEADKSSNKGRKQENGNDIRASAFDPAEVLQKDAQPKAEELHTVSELTYSFESITMPSDTEDAVDSHPLEDGSVAVVGSASKRLRSLRSVDRGESFEIEVSEPPKLRRKSSQGFSGGFGGFQTSFHSSVDEEENTADEKHEDVTSDDKVKDVILDDSGEGNTQAGKDSAPRLRSLRTIERGESFEIEVSEPPKLRRKARQRFSGGGGMFQTSFHSSVSEDEDSTGDQREEVTKDDHVNVATSDNGVKDVTPDELGEDVTAGDQDEYVAPDDVGKGSVPYLKSLRSVDRGESFEIEVSEPPKLRRRTPRGVSGGAGEFQTSSHSSILEEEENTTDDLREEIRSDDTVRGVTPDGKVKHDKVDDVTSDDENQVTPGDVGKESAPRLRSLRSVDRGESFEIEVSEPPKLRRKAQQGVPSGGGELQMSSHSSVSEEDSMADQHEGDTPDDTVRDLTPEDKIKDVTSDGAVKRGDNDEENELGDIGVESAPRLKTLRSVERGESFEIEVSEPAKLRRKTSAGDYLGGGFRESFNSSLDEEESTTVDQHGESKLRETVKESTPKDTVNEITPSNEDEEVTLTHQGDEGKENTRHLMSLRSVDRGESFEIEVSEPPKLRRKAPRGVFLGTSGFQMSFHTSVYEENENAEHPWTETVSKLQCEVGDKEQDIAPFQEKTDDSVSALNFSENLQSSLTGKHSETVNRMSSFESSSTEQVGHRTMDDRPSFERANSVEMAYVELRKDIAKEKQTTNPFLESDIQKPQKSRPLQSTMQDSFAYQPEPGLRKNANPFHDDLPEDTATKEHAPLARSLWSAERSNTNPFLEDIEREVSFDSKMETVLTTPTARAFKDDSDKQIQEDWIQTGDKPAAEDPSSGHTYSDNLEIRRSMYKSRNQTNLSGMTSADSSDKSSQFTNVTSTSSSDMSRMTSADSTYETEAAVFSPGNPFTIAAVPDDVDPATGSGQGSTYQSFGYPVDESPTVDRFIQLSSGDSKKDYANVSGNEDDISGTEQHSTEGKTTQRTHSVSTINSSYSISFDRLGKLSLTESIDLPADPAVNSLQDEIALATKGHSKLDHAQANEENTQVVIKGKEPWTSKMYQSSEEDKSDDSGDDLFDVDTESHIRVEIEPETPLAHDPLNRRCDSYSTSSDGNDDHQQELNATTWNRTYLTRCQSFGDSGQSIAVEARQSSVSSLDTDVKSPDSPVRFIMHQDNPNENVFIGQHSTIWPGETMPAAVGSGDVLNDENGETGDNEGREEPECDQDLLTQKKRNETSLQDELQRGIDAKWRVECESASDLKASFPTAAEAQTSPRFDGNIAATQDLHTEKPQSQDAKDKLFARAWADAAAAPKADWSSQDSLADPWSVLEADNAFCEGATARPCTGEILKPTICRANSLPNPPVPRPRTIFGESKESARFPFRKQLTMPMSPSPDEEALKIMQTLSKLTKIWDNENTEDDSADVDSAHVAPEDDPFKMSYTSKVVSFSRDNSSELDAVYEDELDDDKYEEKEEEEETVPPKQEGEADTPADARDAAAEKDASLHSKDAFDHNSPHWMEKAASKGAYDSLGRRVRRKSNKKGNTGGDDGRHDDESDEGKGSGESDSGEGADEEYYNEITPETQQEQIVLPTTAEALRLARTEEAGDRQNNNNDWAVFETKASKLQATLNETWTSAGSSELPTSLKEFSAEDLTDQPVSPTVTSVPPNSLEDGDAYPELEEGDRDVEQDDEYAVNENSDTEVSRCERNVITASTDALKDSGSERRSSTSSSGSSSSRPASASEVFANRSWALDEYDRPVDEAEQVDGDVFASSGVIEEGYDGFVPSKESKSRTRSHQRSNGFERVDSLSTSEADDDNQERAYRRPSPTKHRHSRSLNLSTEDDAFKNYEADDDTCSEHATPSTEMKHLPGYLEDMESSILNQCKEDDARANDGDAGEAARPQSKHEVDETNRSETSSHKQNQTATERQIKDDTQQEETVEAESQADASRVVRPECSDQETSVLPVGAGQAEKKHMSQSSVTDMSSFDFSTIRIGNLDPSDTEDLSIFTESENRQWAEQDDESERSWTLQADIGPCSQHRKPKSLPKLHAQPAFSESDNKEMSSDWSPLSPEQADRVLTSRSPHYRFSRDISDGENVCPNPSFSRSIDSLTLMNFESQAAAQMELAAQHGFNSSVDETDARSVSSSDVMSPTPNADGGTPHLVWRDSVLSISSFNLVPSPQASTEDVMLSPSVLQDDVDRNDSPFFRPTHTGDEELSGQFLENEEQKHDTEVRNMHGIRGEKLKRRQKKRPAGEVADILHESHEVDSEEDLERNEEHGAVLKEDSENRNYQSAESKTSLHFKLEPTIATSQLLSKEQTAELEASSLHAEPIANRFSDDEGIADTEGQAENELHRDTSDPKRHTADDSRQDILEAKRTTESSESEQQPESIEDNKRKRLSWMERALSAAHDAYDSLGRRIRRKKKKKSARDGDTSADNENEDNSEEEFTDTEDNASETEEDYPVTLERASKLSSIPHESPQPEDNMLSKGNLEEKTKDSVDTANESDIDTQEIKSSVEFTTLPNAEDLQRNLAEFDNVMQSVTFDGYGRDAQLKTHVLRSDQEKETDRDEPVDAAPTSSDAQELDKSVIDGQTDEEEAKHAEEPTVDVLAVPSREADNSESQEDYGGRSTEDEECESANAWYEEENYKTTTKKTHTPGISYRDTYLTALAEKDEVKQNEEEAQSTEKSTTAGPTSEHGQRTLEDKGAFVPGNVYRETYLSALAGNGAAVYAAEPSHMKSVFGDHLKQEDQMENKSEEEILSRVVCRAVHGEEETGLTDKDSLEQGDQDKQAFDGDSLEGDSPERKVAVGCYQQVETDRHATDIDSLEVPNDMHPVDPDRLVPKPADEDKQGTENVEEPPYDESVLNAVIDVDRRLSESLSEEQSSPPCTPGTKEVDVFDEDGAADIKQKQRTSDSFEASLHRTNECADFALLSTEERMSLASLSQKKKPLFQANEYEQDLQEGTEDFTATPREDRKAIVDTTEADLQVKQVYDKGSAECVSETSNFDVTFINSVADADNLLTKSLSTEDPSLTNMTTSDNGVEDTKELEKAESFSTNSSDYEQKLLQSASATLRVSQPLRTASADYTDTAMMTANNEMVSEQTDFCLENQFLSEQSKLVNKEQNQTADEVLSETEPQTDLNEKERKASFLQRAIPATKDPYDGMGNKLRRKKKKTDAVDGDTKDENDEEGSSEEEFTDTEDEDEGERSEQKDAEVTDEITSTKRSTLYAGPPGSNLSAEIQHRDFDTSDEVPEQSFLEPSRKALEQAPFFSSPDEITETETSAPQLFGDDGSQSFLQEDVATALEASVPSEFYQGNRGEEGMVLQQDLDQRQPTSTDQQLNSEHGQRSLQGHAVSTTMVSPGYSSEPFQQEADEIGIIIPQQTSAYVHGTDEGQRDLEGHTETTLLTSERYPSGSDQEQHLKDEDSRHVNQKGENNIPRSEQGENVEKENVQTAEESSPETEQQTELNEDSRKASFLQRAMSAAKDAYDSMGNELRRRKKKKTDAVDGDTKDENGEEGSSEEEFTDTEDEDEDERSEQKDAEVTDEITSTKRSTLYAGPPGSNLSEEIQHKDFDTSDEFPGREYLEHSSEIREQAPSSSGPDQTITETETSAPQLFDADDSRRFLQGDAGTDSEANVRSEFHQGDLDEDGVVLQQDLDHQRPPSIDQQFSSEHGHCTLESHAHSTTLVSPGYSTEAGQSELTEGGVVVPQPMSTAQVYTTDDGQRVLEGDTEATLETSERCLSGSDQEQQLKDEDSRYVNEKGENNILRSEQGENVDEENVQTAEESSPETEQQTELSEEVRKASFLQRAMSAAKDAYDSMGNKLRRRKKKKTNAVDGDTKDENGEEGSSEEEFTDTEDEDEDERSEQKDAEVTDEITSTKRSTLYAGPPGSNLSEEIQHKDFDTSDEFPGREYLEHSSEIREQAPSSSGPDQTITETETSAPQLFDADDSRRFLQGDAGTDSEANVRSEFHQGDLDEDGVVLQQDLDHQRPPSIDQQFSSEHGHCTLESHAHSTTLVSPGYSTEAGQSELTEGGVVVPQPMSTAQVYTTDDGQRVLEGDTEATLETSERCLSGSDQEQQLKDEDSRYVNEKGENNIPRSEQGENVDEENVQTAEESSPETEQQTELSEEVRKASFLQRAMSAAKDAYDSMGNKLRRRKKKKTNAVDGDTKDENGEEGSSEEEFTDTEDEDEDERSEQKDAEVTDEITSTKRSTLYAGPPGSNLSEKIQHKDSDTSDEFPGREFVKHSSEIREQAPSSSGPDQTITETETSAPQLFDADDSRRFLQGDAGTDSVANVRSEFHQGDLDEDGVVLQQDLDHQQPPSIDQQFSSEHDHCTLESHAHSTTLVSPGYSTEAGQSELTEGGVVVPQPMSTAQVYTTDDGQRVLEGDTETTLETSERCLSGSDQEQQLKDEDSRYVNEKGENNILRSEQGENVDEENVQTAEESSPETEQQTELSEDVRKASFLQRAMSAAKDAYDSMGNKLRRRKKKKTDAVDGDTKDENGEEGSSEEEFTDTEDEDERSEQKDAEVTDEITSTKRSTLYAGPPGSNLSEEIQHRDFDSSDEVPEQSFLEPSRKALEQAPFFSSPDEITETETPAPQLFGGDGSQSFLQKGTETTLQKSTETPLEASVHSVSYHGDLSGGGVVLQQDIDQHHSTSTDQQFSSEHGQHSLQGDPDFTVNVSPGFSSEPLQSEMTEGGIVIQQQKSAAQVYGTDNGQRVLERDAETTLKTSERYLSGSAQDPYLKDEDSRYFIEKEENNVLRSEQGENVDEEIQHKVFDTSDEFPRREYLEHSSEILEQAPSSSGPDQTITETETSAPQLFDADDSRRFLQGDAGTASVANIRLESYQDNLCEKGMVLQQDFDHQRPPYINQQFSSEHGHRTLESHAHSTTLVSPGYSTEAGQSELAEGGLVVQQTKVSAQAYTIDDGQCVLEGDKETTLKTSERYLSGSDQEQHLKDEDSRCVNEKGENNILRSEQGENVDEENVQTAEESSPETEQQTELNEEGRKASFLQRAMSAAKDAYDSMGNKLRRRKKEKTDAVDGNAKDENDEEGSSEEEFTDTEDEDEGERIEQKDAEVTDEITSVKKSALYAGPPGTNLCEEIQHKYSTSSDEVSEQELEPSSSAPSSSDHEASAEMFGADDSLRFLQGASEITVEASYVSEPYQGKYLEQNLMTTGSEGPNTLQEAEELKAESCYRHPSETKQEDEISKSATFSSSQPQSIEDRNITQEDNDANSLEASLMHPHESNQRQNIKKGIIICQTESSSALSSNEDSKHVLPENINSIVTRNTEYSPETRKEDSTTEVNYPYSETFQCETIQDSSTQRLRGAPPQLTSGDSLRELREGADSTAAVINQYMPETRQGESFGEVAAVNLQELEHGSSQLVVYEEEQPRLPEKDKGMIQSRHQISSKTWQENEFNKSAAVSFQEASQADSRHPSSEDRSHSFEGDTTSTKEEARRSFGSDSWRNQELAEGGIAVYREQPDQQSLTAESVDNNEFCQEFLSNTCDPTLKTDLPKGSSDSFGLASSYALTLPPPDSPQYSSADEGRRTLTGDREIGLVLQRREADAAYLEDSQRTLSGDQVMGLSLQQQDTAVTDQKDKQSVLSGDQEMGLGLQESEVGATYLEDSQKILPCDQEIGLILQEREDVTAPIEDTGVLDQSYIGDFAAPPKPPQQILTADCYDGDQDDKPLIEKDAADDGNQVDQENIDPSKMPFSDIFKTTKGKKSKKGKDKDAADKNEKDDVTSNQSASQAQHNQTAVANTADDVTTVTPSSDNATLATPLVVNEKEGGEVVQAEAADVTRSKARDVAKEETNANSSDGKTDLVAAGKDSPAVLYTSETSEVTTPTGEGPQLTLQTKDGAAVVEAQPVKADGSLPPETGREKESLLHDPNPDAMICCTIL